MKPPATITKVFRPEQNPGYDASNLDDTAAFPWRVSTALASRAIHAERAALDGLGPLQPSSSDPAPKVTAVAADCAIDLVIATPSAQRRVRNVVTTDGCEGHNVFLRKETVRVLGVHWSPDRSRLAVRFGYETVSLDYYSPEDETIVIDMRR
jgi:hypothetical protein